MFGSKKWVSYGKKSRCPDLAAGHLRIVTLTLAGTILDAEAGVAHDWRDVHSPERFVADSTEVLVVQGPLLGSAHLPVRHAVRSVSTFVRGHIL